MRSVITAARGPSPLRSTVALSRWRGAGCAGNRSSRTSKQRCTHAAPSIPLYHCSTPVSPVKLGSAIRARAARLQHGRVNAVRRVAADQIKAPRAQRCEARHRRRGGHSSATSAAWPMVSGIAEGDRRQGPPMAIAGRGTLLCIAGKATSPAPRGSRGAPAGRRPRPLSALHPLRAPSVVGTGVATPRRTRLSYWQTVALIGHV
eukprot:gene15086-biopygen4940